MSGYIGNIPTPQATQTRDVFTATAGQTSFATSGYTPGFLDVYLNGVHLVNGTDYTASNGSDVVLSSGATAGDNLEVVAYTTFQTGDFVPTSGGTFAGNVAVNGNLTVDTNTLFVDAASNRVGVGTATPNAKFAVDLPNHVGVGARFQYNSSNTPFCINALNNNGDAYIAWNAAAKSNSDTATYVISSAATKLEAGGGSFRFFNAPSGTAGNDITFSERARIDASGNLLVGKTAASVSGAGLWLYNDGGNYGRINFSSNITGTSFPAIFYNNSGSSVGSITYTTTATSYNTSSDYRLKENVVPLAGAADRLMQIPVCRFNFIADPDTTVDGFLAHEVQAFVPEAVTGEKDAVDKDGKPVYQGIDQSKLVPLLTAALQEALADIATLKAEVAALKGEPA